MRVTNESPIDINPPLTPEAPSLTSRAQPPPWQIAARSVAFERAQADAACFLARFADGSQEPLKVTALRHAGDTAWVIEIGERGRHDLAPMGETCPLKCEMREGGWRLVTEAGCLQVDASPVSFSFERGGLPRFKSVGLDLIVGDVVMSHALFRHPEGFGMCFGLEGGISAEGSLVYGGGEDFGALVKNGRVYDIYNSDALGVNGQLRYQSTPYFQLRNGVGLALLNAAPARFDFGFRRHDVMQVSSSTPGLALLVQTSDGAMEKAAAFRRMLGPVRGVPPWSLGLWLSRCYYKDQAEVESVVKGAKVHGIEAGVINLDARCWMRAETRTDFVWDTSRFDPYTSFLPWLRAQGLQVCLWENPYVSSKTETLYAEGVARGFFATDAQGRPYPYQWVPTGLVGFPQPPVAGLVDFTHPEARIWWKDLHRPFIKAGVRSFKTDFGEEIPHDARFHDGSTGWELRNAYADLYNLCVMEVLEEEAKDDGVLWARSGFARMASTPVKWAGDSQTHWRALRATLRAGLSQAVGGALFWSHDIGGFYGPMPDPELYLRWAQVGLWGSHARTHGTTAREPWEFGDEALAGFREALKVRQILFPYFKDMAERCAREAESFLRPLWMGCPSDLACAHVDDAFFAGPDILVAPFLTPHGGRTVYLPEGDWVCLRTGKMFLGPATLESGRTRALPVYARAASPYLPLFEKVISLLAGK